MNDTFTTGLYIFSSLLQADAAILGLGAVFIVYRLQSLYSQQQSYVDILQKSTIGGVPQASQIMLEGDPQRIAVELKKFEGNRYHPLLKFLAEMESSLRIARLGLIPSLILVALHCILCAIALWWMTRLSASNSQDFVQLVGGILVMLFAVVLIEVITAAQVALGSKPFMKFFPLGPRIWTVR